MRIALGVEYDGAHYHGWQKQIGLSTVQAELEAAIGKVANHEISTVCAGRTDTGVHATGQVVHFDTSVNRSARSWVFGTNHYLPNNISVIWAKHMDDEFHARHSAKSRRYCYLIYNSPIRPALYRDALSWHYKSLNVARMQQAAQYLIGEHDFTSFRALECQAKSPVRTIHALQVTQHNGLIIIDVTANAFLHHMVRNIAGVLIAVGVNNKEPEWTRELLQLRDRSRGGITAPPYGLYLTDVTYAAAYQLPKARMAPFLLFNHECSNTGD